MDSCVEGCILGIWMRTHREAMNTVMMGERSLESIDRASKTVASRVPSRISGTVLYVEVEAIEFRVSSPWRKSGSSDGGRNGISQWRIVYFCVSPESNGTRRPHTERGEFSGRGYRKDGGGRRGDRDAELVGAGTGRKQGVHTSVPNLPLEGTGPNVACCPCAETECICRVGYRVKTRRRPEGRRETQRRTSEGRRRKKGGLYVRD
jgi:hypothetical protein